MRCVHCQNDAKYKDRSDRKCPACHRAFVFEPRTGDRFTDMGFQAAINRVSRHIEALASSSVAMIWLCRWNARSNIGV